MKLLDRLAAALQIAGLCLVVITRGASAQQVSSNGAIVRSEEMREAIQLIHERGTPSIALVLSGGGAKGLAHIGVLDVFDSAHIPIDLIVGTSMGAAIGGLYASGYSPQQLEDFARTTNWTDVLDFDDDSHRIERLINQKDRDNAILSLRFTGFFKPVLPQAISSGQRLTMLLNGMIINAPEGTAQDFLRDLRVPFIALATDIVSGKRRLITRGDLTSAMRASITLPLRFTPVSEDSAILVDGGLSSNIPVDIAKDSAGSDLAVVSNTTSGLKSRDNLNTPWDVADQVITLMMQRQSKESLLRADAVITPAIELDAQDFQNVPAIIESGRVAARAALPRLKLLLANRKSSAPETDDPRDADLVLDTLAAISIHAYGARVPESVYAVTSTLKHTALTYHSLKQSIEEPLLNAFRRSGYTLARIDSVEIRRATRAIEVYVDEGRIAAVRVVGGESIHPDVVLREFPLTDGDIFKADDAERGLHNMTSTGFFDFASIEIIHDTSWRGTVYRERGPSEPDPPDAPETLRSGPIIRLTVQERAPNVLRLGVLADNEYGAQFSTELANENLFGSGTYISAKGGLGPLSRYGAITFEAPRLFRSSASLLGQVYSSSKDISVYSTKPDPNTGKIISDITDVVRESRDLGIRLKAGGEVGRIGEVSGEIRTERQRYFSVESLDAPATTTHVTALKAAIDIDSRNDRDFPQEGTYLTGFYEIGTKLLGGESGYTKIYASFEQAIRISGLHTMIPRIAAGFGDATLPRLEQFAFGGISSFYGLGDMESRGRQMVLGSLEYQVEIPHALFFPTFVSARYDVGATWLAPEAIKFEAFIHGLGLGIGLRTPLGVLRFAIGENFRFSKIETRPVDLNKPHFYFSIGSNL